MIDDILPSLTQRLGPMIAVAAAEVAGFEDLHPDELATVARAVPKRRAEFAAGRRAARRALADLGHAPVALSVGPNRAPVWPEHVTGSITHDAGWALAGAASTRDVRSLGLDLTQAMALPEGVREQVLRHPDEVGLNDLSARAVFSAKEAIYKALAPSVGQVFGFSVVAVRPDVEAGHFDARLIHPLGPFSEGALWRGLLICRGSWLVTGLVVPA